MNANKQKLQDNKIKKATKKFAKILFDFLHGVICIRFSRTSNNSKYFHCRHHPSSLSLNQWIEKLVDHFVSL